MDALTWQHRHLGIGDPDAFMAVRLERADAWVDGSGCWQPVGDLHEQKLWMLLLYLHAHAPELMAQGPGRPAGDPDRWLASRPLVRAVDAELAARGQCEPGEALAAVQALGLAPWERAVGATRGR